MDGQQPVASATVRILPHLQSHFAFELWRWPHSPKRVSHCGRRERNVRLFLGTRFSVLAGADLHRDSIPDLKLDRAGVQGKFESAGSNALTISSFSPFVAAGGSLSRWIHYSL